MDLLVLDDCGTSIYWTRRLPRIVTVSEAEYTGEGALKEHVGICAPSWRLI